MSFETLLRSTVRTGSMVLIDGGGRRHRIGDATPPVATLRLTRRLLDYTLALNPRLGLGEAYADGGAVLEQGSIVDLLGLLARNLGNLGRRHWLSLGGGLGGGWRRGIPIGRARRNVAHHYDLPPEFYDLFLDPDRQYSCAYFMSPDDTLEQAQFQKKRHIAAKLLLDRPGLRVLDIGSGWGGLALFLAADASADVTGISLSGEQVRAATARAEAAGQSDQVRFLETDYRQVAGQYDRIVSVGMFEHVGRGSYGVFFARLRALLREDGVALLHSIGHGDAPGPIDPFIAKHIFPGAAIPSLSEVLAEVERAGLAATDVEILRLHYAHTLQRWRERFTARRAEVVARYGERFFRTWEYYFALCEVGFRWRGSMVFQLQLARRNDTLPITRDYMVGHERRPAAQSASAEPAAPAAEAPPMSVRSGL